MRFGRGEKEREITMAIRLRRKERERERPSIYETEWREEGGREGVHLQLDETERWRR